MRTPWYEPKVLTPLSTDQYNPGIAALRRPPRASSKTARSARKAQHPRRPQSNSSILSQRRSGQIHHSRQPRSGIRTARPSQRRARHRYLRPFHPNTAQPLRRTAAVVKYLHTLTPSLIHPAPADTKRQTTNSSPSQTTASNQCQWATSSTQKPPSYGAASWS